MKDEFRIMKDETSHWEAVRKIAVGSPKGGTALREQSAVKHAAGKRCVRFAALAPASSAFQAPRCVGYPDRPHDPVLP